MIQFFSRKLKNRKGFTIIELLVVIALLGILAGIAVPRMTGLTGNARETADAASMQTLLRDTQVAIASGQIDPTTDVTGGVVNVGAGEYFTSLPTPQVKTNAGADAAFSITLTQIGTSSVYTITVSSTAETVADITGEAEFID